jgi:hypothetical protein
MTNPTDAFRMELVLSTAQRDGRLMEVARARARAGDRHGLPQGEAPETFPFGV